MVAAISVQGDVRLYLLAVRRACGGVFPCFRRRRPCSPISWLLMSTLN